MGLRLGGGGGEFGAGELDARQAVATRARGSEARRGEVGLIRGRGGEGRAVSGGGRRWGSGFSDCAESRR